jgi:tetratricopeptide (TPR) repeat protein
MASVVVPRNSPGPEPANPSPETAPTGLSGVILGPCRLLHELGSGGMGQVYLAEMEVDRPYAARGSQVAIKILHSILMGDEEFVLRFDREARVGIAIENLRVARSYEAGTETVKGRHIMYIVIEYVEGMPLRRLINDLGTLPEALLRDLAAEVAQGLAAVHGAGAVHRDIKPENVLITPAHHVKIMDLGIVSMGSADTRLTRVGMAVGTFNYAAPEQLSGEVVGPAADMYALGVMMYEAATHIQPFAAENAAATMWRQYQLVPKRLGDIDGRLSPFIEEVVATLLEKDPTKRFFTATMLEQVLREGESSSWWLSREMAARIAEGGHALRKAGIARDAAFVGRAPEMAKLGKIVADTIDGTAGKVLVIEGDMGIGKSRLLDEVVRRLEMITPRPTILYGSCPPEGTGYAGIASAVVDYFGVGAIDSRLAGFVAGPPALVAAFSTLLTGVGVAAGQRMSDDTVQGLFAELADNIAKRRPVIWIIDNVHFASQETQKVIQLLARKAASNRILLILSGRTSSALENIVNEALFSNADRIRLAPLSPRDVVALVAQKVSRPSLAEDLGNTLSVRLDGNPLFILETLREFQDDGTISELIENPTSGRRRIDASTVAPSVRGFVLSRLRHLSDEERSLLEIAATIGHEFDPDLVSRVAGEARLGVLQTLSALERRTGIVRSAGSAFRFDLHELREAVYDTMSPLLRVAYHGEIANAYRARADIVPVAGSDAVFLSTHYLKGHHLAEGLSFVGPALEYLSASYGADKTGLDLADLAIQEMGNAHTVLECEIQLRRAEFLHRLGRTDDQRAAAEAALSTAVQLGDDSLRARSGLALARSRILVGEYATAEELLRSSLLLAEATGDRYTELAIVGNLGRVYLLSGRLAEARAAFEREVGLARDLADRRLECRALGYLSNLLLSQNEHDEALDYLEREMAISQEIGYRESEITASFGLGMVRLWRGEHGLAGKHLKHQLNITRDLAHGGALAHFGLVQYWYECGQLEKAERHLQLAMDRARAANLRHFVAYLHLYDGEIKRARGQLPEALEAYRQALAVSTQVGAKMTIAESAFAIGRSLIETGDTDGARAFLNQSRDLVVQLKLAAPGPLPAAYLATIGDEDPSTIPYEPMGRSSGWVELHLVLHRLGRGMFHLTRAGLMLERMSSHLDDDEREQFWTSYPNAREYRRVASLSSR